MIRLLRRSSLCAALRRTSTRGLKSCCPGLWAALLLILVCAGVPFRSGAASNKELADEVQRVIREFRPRIGVAAPVTIAIVPRNPRLISVEYAPGRTDLFQMTFEEGFLRSLNEAELRAAVAHEMGHIWIYTHFPFLQTEKLANRQALKLVVHRDLAGIYEKVWRWNGEKGDLAKVLDPEPGAGDQGAAGLAAGLGQAPRGDGAGGAAGPGPAVFVESKAGGTRSLTGISPAEPDASPDYVPAILNRLSRDCPSCRMASARRNADYIISFSDGTRSGGGSWAVYSRGGSLAASGRISGASDPASEISRALLKHWRRHRR